MLLWEDFHYIIVIVVITDNATYVDHVSYLWARMVFLVVTQRITSHQLLCVRVTALSGILL